MHLCSVAAVAVVSLCAASANAAITSTFDTDAEGWSATEDFADFAWSSTLDNPITDNPSGGITARDRGRGTIWKFRASSAYEGDLSSFGGGTLSWDILGVNGNQTSVPNRADVLISGGGITIGIDADVVPILDAWTPWSVTLDASQDWRVVTDFADARVTSASVATQQQIDAVLADVTGLFLRGEFTNGSNDATAIDNVRLEIPAPTGTAILPIASFVALRRRRA